MTRARTRSTGTEVDERVGRRVRRMRAERGWSFQGLSLAIHDATRDDPDGPKEISPAVLRNMEEGVPIQGVRVPRRITVGEAVILARVFKITVGELIGEEAG